MIKKLLGLCVVLMSCVGVAWGQLGQRSTSIVTIDGQRYYVHTVQIGETVYSLSKLYKLEAQEIVAENSIAVEALSVGQRLKIPLPDDKRNVQKSRQLRLFDIHRVNSGETTYSIARRYGISIQDLIADNPNLDPQSLRIGEELRIRKEEIGATRNEDIQREWQTYRDNLDGLSKDFEHHLVEKGETLYGLCRQYGISEDTLRYYNPKELADGLKLWSIIRIPVAGGKPKIAVKVASTAGTHVIAPAVSTATVSSGPPSTGTTSASTAATSRVSVQEAAARAFGRPQADSSPAQKLTSTSINQVASDPILSTRPRSDVPQQQISSTKTTTLRPRSLPEHQTTFPEEVRTRYRATGAPIHVALLLPLRVDAKENTSFVEFYYGMLLALEELKTEGISVDLNVMNSGRSKEIVDELIAAGKLDRADLIIGPVYDEAFVPVAAFAQKNRIPVVSPLGVVTADNGYVYEVAPREEFKYDKLRELFEGGKNVVVIDPVTGGDPEFGKEIAEITRNSTSRIQYLKETSARAIEQQLDPNQENVIVVLSENENITEQILARISSIQNNVTATTGRTLPLTVVGSSRWGRYLNLDKELYFKLNVQYVSSYHVDRSAAVVANFDRRYLDAFHALPSLYAYRGYDVTLLFLTLLKTYEGDFPNLITGMTHCFLQVPYRFVRERPRGKFENNEWVVVKYRDDYTIEVR